VEHDPQVEHDPKGDNDNLYLNWGTQTDVWIGGEPGKTSSLIVTGNIGIGTEKPGSKLEINGGDLLFKAASGELCNDPGDIIFAAADNKQKARIWSEPTASSGLHLCANASSTADISIDAEGRVGIGVSSPYRKGFKLTGQSLERLRAEGVSHDVLERLKSIENEEFIGEWEADVAFMKRVRDTLGEESASQYEARIRKQASFSAKLYVNGGATINGGIDIGGTVDASCMRVNRYPLFDVRTYNLNDQGRYKTQYSTKEWEAFVGGFIAGRGDIQEHGPQDTIVKCWMNGEGCQWIVEADFASQPPHEPWTVKVLFLRKELTSAHM
jgi:hypothetical protein